MTTTTNKQQFKFYRRDKYIAAICNFFLRFASDDYNAIISTSISAGLASMAKEAVNDLTYEELLDLEERLDQLDYAKTGVSKRQGS